MNQTDREVIIRISQLLDDAFGDKRPTIEQMAVATGLSKATVTNWIKGRVERTDLRTVKAWCDYLNVQPGEIFHYIPDTTKET